MGVLVPLYLAGLAALSLPLIFHLVRRTPRGRQEFSSLMFLSPTIPKLTRRSRLDQIFLLLLRLSALALLAIAFCRPFLRQVAALTFNDLPGRRVAILIDTSASLRRGDLWQQATKLAEKELDELNPQDDVALFAFSDRLETLIDFDQEGAAPIPNKPEVVRTRLKSLEPSWHATDLGLALVTVAGEIAATTDVRQSALEPQIVAISDFQKGARIEALQAFEWPPQVPVIVRQVAPAKRTNATVQILHGDDDDPENTDLRARVVNASDSSGEQFLVGWSGVAVKAARDRDVGVYVPAGQSRVVRLPRGDDQLLADRVQLRGDDHDFDNTYFVVPPRKQEATMYYLGEDTADDQKGTQYFLRLAVANDPLRQVSVQPLDPAKPSALEWGEEKKSLLVASSAVSAEWQKTIKEYVGQGALALFAPSTREAALSLPSFFDDIEVVPPEVEAKSDYLLFGEIDFTHPLFAPFAGSRYNDFTKIHFWMHRSLNQKSPGTSNIIARFDDRAPALFERPLGKGKLIALAGSWRPEESQLALSSKFVPLIAGLIDLACGGAEEAASVSIGEPVPLPFAPGPSNLFVQTPAGQPARADADGRFSATDLPGIYQAKAGTAEWRFAANLTAAESNTAPLDLEQLEQRGVRLGSGLTRAERIDRVRQQRDNELEASQKLWRWLIVAAIAVLIIETWWAGRAERKIMSAAQAA